MSAALPDDGPGGKPKRVHPPGSLTIRCRLDGPLVAELPPDAPVLGLSIRVIDHEGREFPLPLGDRPVALCRCGHSATKPFCDGSHKGSGFTARDTSPAPPPSGE